VTNSESNRSRKLPWLKSPLVIVSGLALSFSHQRHQLARVPGIAHPLMHRPVDAPNGAARL